MKPKCPDPCMDYTFTPDDSINNQQYYIQDLPSKSKGKLKINIADLPEGNYALEIYKTGYRCNDAYTTYYDLGRPDQLTKQQVEQIKKMNNGSPVSSEIINVKSGKAFTKDLDLKMILSGEYGEVKKDTTSSLRLAVKSLAIVGLRSVGFARCVDIAPKLRHCGAGKQSVVLLTDFFRAPLRLYATPYVYIK